MLIRIFIKFRGTLADFYELQECTTKAVNINNYAWLQESRGTLEKEEKEDGRQACQSS
jgi:hypothetical protein